MSGEALPEGWVWTKVGQIGSVQLGRQRSPKNRSKDFATKYIRAANITEQGLDLSDILEMEFRPDEKARYLLIAGDIVLSEASGSESQVGKPALWDDQVKGYCFQNTVIRLRTWVGDRRYFLAYFRHCYLSGTFGRLATGVGINHLGAERFSGLPVPLPPLAEQCRIVAAIEAQFSRLDAALAALWRVQAKLKRYRAAVLKAACEGRLVPSEVKALPAIPLGDLLAEPLSNGRSVPTSPEGFPVLRLTSLKGGGIDLGEFKIGAWTEREARPYLVRRGDFLVSRGNGSLSLVGKGGLVDREPHGVAYPDTLIRVRVDERRVLGEYLRLAWQSEGLRRQIEASARTTAGIYKINQQSMRDYVVPLPPLAEQHRIVAEVERRLSVIQAVEAAVEANLRRATMLRQAILRRAFEGKLVPQDPNDEPAGALLERIRAERAQAGAPARRRAKRRRGLTPPLEL